MKNKGGKARNYKVREKFCREMRKTKWKNGKKKMGKAREIKFPNIIIEKF